MTTKAEYAWLDMVATLDCVACGDRPVQVHHLRTGYGMSQRAPHRLTIALCPDCHHAFHHGDGLLRRLKVSELELLSRTIAGVQALMEDRQ